MGVDGHSAEMLVVEALQDLGIALGRHASDDGVDLVVDPDGAGARIQVKARALVTDDIARQLVAEAATRDASLVVVADRVTSSAREVLIAERAGYLDRRGRFALRAGGLVIDVDIPSTHRRTARSSALAGRAGLEVATALLLQPDVHWPVRALARELQRSASTVSEVLSALRRDELIDSENTVTDAQLFWRVADHWRATPTYLAQMPDREGPVAEALQLGTSDPEESGWAMSDSAAAAIYGAPVALHTEQAPTFYVPTHAVTRRAATLLGTPTAAASAACVAKAAPVPAVCRDRVVPRDGSAWLLAHPLFVALDLAQDSGRGREILASWTPEVGTRVW